MSKARLPRPPALLAALLTLSLAVPVTASPDTPFYLVDGERIELEVVADSITVGRTRGDETAAEVEAALAAVGTLVGVEPLTPGVWRVDLPPEPQAEPRTAGEARPAERGRRLHAQRAAIERTVELPETEWAYPVLRNPKTGTLLYVTPRIVLAVGEGIDDDRLFHLLPASLRLVRPMRTAGQYVVELTAPRHDDPGQVTGELTELPWVRWAEPDFIQGWRPEAIPDDPLFSEQWHLVNVGQGSGLPGADARLADAWELETGDGSVVIAVIDDGVQLDHPDLPIYTNPGETPGDGMDNDGNGLVDDVHGWDFYDGDNDPDPCTSAGCSPGVGSHGTAVAGVAAATGDNATGVSGACQDCRILPVRISNHNAGFASSSVIADAIDYAGELADVLNNSWGGGSPSAAINSAVAGAHGNGRGGLGAPVLFATGNSASGHRFFSLGGIPAGTWTFTWTFLKDAMVSAGLDAAWLDDVVFQDGSVESFEGCGSLPSGWVSGGAVGWSVVDDPARANSDLGGHCAARSGAISHGETSTISVTKSFASAGSLAYSLWVSAERTTADGEGPLVTDDLSGLPECFDYVQLTVFDGASTLGPFHRACGTWSTQGNPLADGTISYPSSLADAIAVGAATNHDTRSDYGQWQADAIDFVCHSSGGSLRITSTDLTGSDGYDSSSYTDAFGASGFAGTSSATPLCAGIAGLVLSRAPGLTSTQVRSHLQASTRKIGSVPYVAGRNDFYGYGAVSARMAMFPGCADGAPVTLDISGETVTGGSETYEACDRLTADTFVVGIAATVVLQAGRQVVLEPGVEVSGTFSASVVGTL